MKGNKGVTVLELLISITLIGILAAAGWNFFASMSGISAETVNFSDTSRNFQILEQYIRNDLSCFSSDFSTNENGFHFIRNRAGETHLKPQNDTVSYIIEEKGLARRINGREETIFTGIDSIEASIEGRLVSVKCSSSGKTMAVLIHVPEIETPETF